MNLRSRFASAAATVAAACAAQSGTQEPSDAAAALAVCAAEIVRYDGTDMPALESVAVETSTGAILLLGARHSRDPGDPQNARIADAFAAFDPDVALFEGPDRGEAETADATIRDMGESGYVRFLAKKAGAHVGPLDPDPREEFLYVLETFTVEQAALFYLLRSAAQWRDREGVRGAEMDARMEAFLARANSLFESLPPPNDHFRLESTADLSALYARNFTAPPDWRDAPMRWFSPEQKDLDTGGQFTNAVNARSSDFRNINMYRAAAGPSLDGRRVFGVVGGDHLPRLKPALECLGRTG